MKSIYKKLFVIMTWTISNGISLFIFLILINMLDLKMLRAGFLEGSGVFQFIKVYVGIPLLFILSMGWIASFIYIYHYYSEGIEKKRLCQSFFVVTTIQMYLIPVVVLINKLVFDLELITTDLVIIGLGLLLGSISYYIVKNKSIQKS